MHTQLLETLKGGGGCTSDHHHKVSKTLYSVAAGQRLSNVNDIAIDVLASHRVAPDASKTARVRRAVRPGS